MTFKMFKGKSLRELHHSRLSGVYFVKLATDDWRHVFAGEGESATVGPLYKSRGELLADSVRYCRENWGIGDSYDIGAEGEGE